MRLSPSYRNLNAADDDHRYVHRSVIVLTPEDLLASVYMCLNQLAPAYHSLELGEYVTDKYCTENNLTMDIDG